MKTPKEDNGLNEHTFVFKQLNAKEKFMEIYKELPEQAHTHLVLDPYGKEPMTLFVCYNEIKYNTKLSKKILKRLGFK